MRLTLRRFFTAALVLGLSLSACKGGDGDQVRDDVKNDDSATARLDDTGRGSGLRGRDRDDDAARDRRAPARDQGDAERTGSQAARTPPLLSPKRVAPADVRDFRLGSGTDVELRNSVELNSRNTRRGAPVTATAVRAVYSARGDTVIPAGAEFVGRVTAIAPAERPGAEGTLRIEFDSIRLNGRTLPIDVRVDSMAAVTKGRGVTAGDAAKVGAGAAVGGVAGRVIGGDRRGTIIGAAAGAAAGAVIAHNTRDIDIVLPVGGVVHVALTRAFDATRAYTRR
jgi:hypothetical protein